MSSVNWVASPKPTFWQNCYNRGNGEDDLPESNNKIRVILADDHPMLRETLKTSWNGSLILQWVGKGFPWRRSDNPDLGAT